jgi:pilus assembly protein CpaB
MRPKSIILLVLALGCGLVASIGINQVLANRGKMPVAPVGETVPIFVALADIGMGDELTLENIKLEAWPKDKVPAGAMTKLEEVENRRTRTRLYAGEPVLEAKLFSEGASAQGGSVLIPKGMRVVSVKVDNVSSSSGMILPGDRVDVLVHMVENEGKGIPETATRTVLQDVKVFAVNDLYTRDPRDKDETSISAKTISLLVTPQQAELITLASEVGSIRLTMRSLEDEGSTEAGGAAIGELLGTAKTDRDDESLVDDGEKKDDSLLSLLDSKPQPKAEEPEPAPALPTWKMVVLRGEEAEQVEFAPEGGLPEKVTEDPANPPAGPSISSAQGDTDTDSDSGGDKGDDSGSDQGDSTSEEDGASAPDNHGEME